MDYPDPRNDVIINNSIYINIIIIFVLNTCTNTRITVFEKFILLRHPLLRRRHRHLRSFLTRWN